MLFVIFPYFTTLCTLLKFPRYNRALFDVKMWLRKTGYLSTRSGYTINTIWPQILASYPVQRCSDITTTTGQMRRRNISGVKGTLSLESDSRRYRCDGEAALLAAAATVILQSQCSSFLLFCRP